MAKQAKQKDSEQEQKQWKRPCDIKVVRTKNARTMEGKFLAEDACRKWTEDFIDEDTGATVSIERKEKFFNRGTYLSKDMVCEVQFHIQAGDIEDVAVSETCFDVTRFIMNSLIPFEVSVSVSCAAGFMKHMYLTRAQSVEKAIQVALEYAGIYLHLGGWVSVKQVKQCDYYIIEDSDECIPENAPDNPEADYEYYKVTVQSRFFNSLDDEIEKSNYTYIIKAQDVGEAKERITNYCLKMWEKELKNPRNSFVVLKGQPYDTDGVVPVSYCELYKEQQEY